MDLCADGWLYFGALTQPLFQKMLTATRKRGLRHILFFPSGRCRKRESERLVVEVNTISVSPNKAWLFSF